MTQDVSFVMQADNIHLFLNGEVHVINKNTHIRYDDIVVALDKQDWDTVFELCDMKRAFLTYASNDGQIEVEIRSNTVVVNGEELHDALGRRLFEMAQSNLPVQYMMEFLSRLRQNPSERANSELYGMLEHNTLPITPRGTFYAYKKVKRHTGKPFEDALGRTVRFNDFVDCYTGKLRNNPGDVVTMDRKEVDPDQNRTCSVGLHFSSLDYAANFSRNGALMIVEIDPADVVSIPTDYDNQKGRTCEYKVVSIHAEGDEYPAEAFTEPVSNVGYVEPDGERWKVLSTNEANAGTQVAEFAERSDAEEYVERFEDLEIVDSYAIAALTAANVQFEAERAAAEDEAEEESSES